MSTDTIFLNRALAAENLSFPIYTLLHAVHENGGPMTVASISLSTGYSYWAVRNHIRRTPWFLNIGDVRNTAIVPSKEGKEKLARVQRRISADHL